MKIPAPVTTKALLTAGLVAGPLFLTTWLVQVLVRDGFDPRKHTLSLLSLGEGGWVQISNFVVTGVLFAACAAGLHRAEVPGTRWGPRLVALLGLGLILGGVFVTDPGAGFPAGAPPGAPEEITVTGMLHSAGAGIAMVSGIAATIVYARAFRRAGDRHDTRAARACVLAAVAAGAVLIYPSPDGLSLRLVAASAILYAFVAAVAAHARARVASPETPVTPSERSAR
ncbi:DUF998 domain-containing protein [Jiangella mangrovi]|uniref:DUF998 domain-containing protein n=1 Tax=Jiangella mangrovi TaxID=1524084 RepID=A0A7W9LMQ2_9ACTN|nr:DUF998 domain-containing protein [Jiangella mangrovi]MBB5789342.1 hypothetical protein [Jiangella mangrovi]